MFVEDFLTNRSGMRWKCRAPACGYSEWLTDVVEDTE